MTRFGAEWEDHPAKIARGVAATVGPNDLLLLPGDLSWASKRRDAQPDLEFLAALPGIKVCIRGNHDFWWESDRRIHFPGLFDPPARFERGALGIAGTRGWQTVRAESKDLDEKIIARERVRLQKSLQAIVDCPRKIAMLHYPPHPFVDILAAAGVTDCVYGHVHLRSLPEDEALVLNGEPMEGVRCWCVACDRIGFTPVELPVSGGAPSLRS